MTSKSLRFAALIRVSTEQQEKTGESLRTQRTDIERSVCELGGRISSWYGGQEHATPGYEKKEVDRLIADAAKGKFDAVIVAHADRWSRDNVKSSEGLRVFEQHRIRFYVNCTEYDLYNPEHTLFLGMSAVIGRFLALNQNRKSIQSRIARAKRGLPTGGKLPFGRTFDRKTETWGIDPTKQKLVKDVATRYLNGESMAHLALEYGINHSALHRTLMQRCGTDWQIDFVAPELNIKETVPIEVPALLDDRTIKALHHQARANRTYEKGKIVHSYLFGGMVFCATCHYAMFGQTNHNRNRYYRHNLREGARACSCRPRPWVRADDLEAVVMNHLFECFGNPAAVQKAVEAASPRLEKMGEYREESERIDGALTKIRAGRARIIKLVANGHINESDAEHQLKELATNEGIQLAAKERLEAYLSNVPTQDGIRAVADRLSARFYIEKNSANTCLDQMTWDERRSLAQMVFSGNRADGKRMGIYIEFLKSEKGCRTKTWRYTIHGHLIHEDGYLPLSKARMDAFFTFGAAPLQKQLVAISALP